MRVLSVNVGQRRPIRAKTGHSGIFKEPASGPVWVGESGLAGDHIADTRHHGGPSRAVYVFTRPDHAAWEAVLGRALPPGTFGENVLLSDLESAPLRVGQTLRLGAAMLELTAPRIPCVTLAVSGPHSGRWRPAKTFTPSSGAARATWSRPTETASRNICTSPGPRSIEEESLSRNAPAPKEKAGAFAPAFCFAICLQLSAFSLSSGCPSRT